MSRFAKPLAAASLLLAALEPAAGADVQAGRAAFRQSCVICHTAESDDSGGAQGPSLVGVFGRHAAGNPSLTYTRALADSNLTWDAATLDRFLESPATVVPGTAMVVAVADRATREDLVAYLQSVAASADAATATAAPTPTSARVRFGDAVKVYVAEFTPMYHALTARKVFISTSSPGS